MKRYQQPVGERVLDRIQRAIDCLPIKRVCAAVVGVCTSSFALAALPPQHQMTRDLAVLVAFVQAHPKVAASLRQIDMEHYIVHFGRDCQAVFTRPDILVPPGFAGPAAALVLTSTSCRVD